MTPVQEKLFCLYREIHDLCVRNNITYYLAGGSTIGAVRHGGFLPWDDDMDLMMTRGEWLRFVELCRCEIPDGRVLDCQEMSRDCPNMFGRYTDLHSAAIHSNQILGDGAAEFVIDILVLDPVPDREAYERYVEDLMLYSDLINPMLNYSYRFGVNKKRYRKYRRRMRLEGKDAVLSELERAMFSYDEAVCPYVVLRWGGVPFLFPKEMFGEPRIGEFEGVPCLLPARTSDYLVRHYGDEWMRIPPKREQETHEAIMSPTTGYKTIQRDYLPFLDVPKTRRAFLKRKRFFLSGMDKRLAGKQQEVSQICLGAKFALEDAIRRSSVDPEEALETHRYDELRELFRDYLKLQLSRKIAGREDYIGIHRFQRPGFIDIDDRTLHVAVRLLIDTGEVAKADRLLQIRRTAKGGLAGALLEDQELILAIREAVSLEDVGEKEEALRLLKSLYEKEPWCDPVSSNFLRMLIRSREFGMAQVVACRAKERFPENGIYDKYLGDLAYFADEDRETALKCYRAALQKTRDGLAIREMKKRIGELKNVEEGDAPDASRHRDLPPPGPASNEIALLQKKAVTLLEELATLCETGSIPFFLGPRTLSLAVKYGGCSRCSTTLDLLVPAADVPRLLLRIRRIARPGRTVDCMDGDPDHLSFEAEYVDTGTTYLSFAAGTDYAACGIKVKIIPIRTSLTGLSLRLYGILETGWEINGYRLTTKITLRRIISAGIVRMLMTLFGKKRLASWLFRRFYAMHAREGKQEGWDEDPAVIRRPKQKSKCFSGSYFEGSEQVMFCGRSYPAPRNLEGFLREYYGADWSARLGRERKSFKGYVLIANTPYREFLRACEERGYPVGQLFRQRRREMIRGALVLSAFRARSRALLLAKRSGDRLRFYEYFLANREEIRTLFERNDLEGLRMHFAEHERCCLSYLKKGLGLCVSREIHEIQLRLLRDAGKVEEAERLASLVPREHMLPLICGDGEAPSPAGAGRSVQSAGDGGSVQLAEAAGAAGELV
ncbi:MAG: LicD family protein [Anaerovoracaceae bacterium]|jgi:phosphorylcholine metabolism protein LicD